MTAHTLSLGEADWDMDVVRERLFIRVARIKRLEVI